MKIPEDFRLQLFECLLGPVYVLPMGDLARDVLSRAAARQLADLEPIIEKLLDSVAEHPP